MSNSASCSYAFQVHQKVKQICSPLFDKSSTKYFCYQRLTQSGSYTFLPSDPTLGEFFFCSEKRPSMWFLDIDFANIKTGYNYWDLTYRTISKENFIDTYKNKAIHTDLVHGIDIVVKFEEFVDIYCFASNMLDIYLEPIQELILFSNYFNQEATKLLKQAWNEPIIIHSQQLDQKIPLVIVNHENKIDNENYQMKRYYFSEFNHEIYLTSQEVNLLKLVNMGHTAKTAAKAQDISFRTVQRHFENIREKLNCSNITEAVCVAEKNFLV